MIHGKQRNALRVERSTKFFVFDHRQCMSDKGDLQAVLRNIFTGDGTH
ncbi:Uncharacterised protein [Vibrio cholerae]|uniref:Uncharacterized protein n=1 Tax=Vibrio cholerae TaxID=666 RepID=A0A655ZMU9_VIBCL|nr:Uncharacterised protein [Vibrio cholerae]